MCISEEKKNADIQYKCLIPIFSKFVYTYILCISM